MVAPVDGMVPLVKTPPDAGCSACTSRSAVSPCGLAVCPPAPVPLSAHTLMPPLTSVSDLQTWIQSQHVRCGTTPTRTDAWMEAASALRHAALGVDGVIGLSESASFQTRGPGTSVYGVALAPLLSGGLLADIAVVVDANALHGLWTLAALAQSVESAVYATWERIGDREELTVHVHVVDLAARRAALRVVEDDERARKGDGV